MRELDKVLDSSEKVFWEGNPKFWPFLLGGSVGVLFGLLFLVVGGFFVIQGIKSGNYLIIFLPHFWLGVLFVFVPPIYQLLVYKHTHYAITNKRVIIQKGVIGRDFEMVDFDQITNADVNVGLTDKLFGGSSGSISISSAGTLTYSRQGAVSRPYVLRHIQNPYEVFKFFKKVSHDIKTDIQFPNKYRPVANPGYRSDYSPDRK